MSSHASIRAKTKAEERTTIMEAFTEPKIVIAVFGDSNVGKSTLLMQFVANMEKACDKGTVFRSPHRGRKSNTPRDTRMAGVYHGIKIGISTSGDDAKCIFENFYFFQEHQCRIAVTAVHKKEDTSVSALDLIVEHYSMIMLRKIEKIREDKKTFNKATSPLSAPEFTKPLSELSARLDDAVSLLRQLDAAETSSIRKQVIVVNQ